MDDVLHRFRGPSPTTPGMRPPRRSLDGSTRAVASALVLVVAAACGGGGGGGPAPTTTPRPSAIPIFTPPRVTPTPSPVPTAGPGMPQVILSEGDTIAEGLRVNDIREASLLEGRQAGAAIIRATGSEDRAVLRRADDGSWSIVFDAAIAPETLDLTTLEDLEVATDGSILFRAGDGLDTDFLYLATGPTAVALAGASPGVVDPEFRFLGAADLGRNGGVAFVGGGDPCEVDEEGSTRCDLHLYTAEGSPPTEVEISDNDLENQNPRSPRAIVTDTGVVYFSMRGSGEEAVLVRVADGEVDTLFSVDSTISGVGRLINPTLAAVLEDGRFVVTTALAEDMPPRSVVLGILDPTEGSRSFTEIARIGDPLAGETIVDLDVVGVDDQGAVLYLATTRQTEGEEPDETLRFALRLFDGTSSSDVAIEGELLPGGAEDVIRLRDPRFNRRGEVAFVAELGDVSQTPNGPTVTVRGTELLVRSPDGTYSTRLPAEDAEGVLVEVAELAAFDDEGTVLAIGSLEEDNDELLIVVPPPASP